MTERPQVVIVGAGFAGLWAARRLARSPAQVTVIDAHNYHSFLPLLYQVAAAELEPEAIAYPVRSITRHWPHTRFIQARVTGLDPDRRLVYAGRLTLPYDYLLIAVGSAAHFFGVPGAAEQAFVLKTLDDAIALRNHILSSFELAEQLPEGAARREALTFVIVGGGPTGLEFSGALVELIRGPLLRDYPLLRREDVRVILLEAAGHLLPGLPASLQRYAARRLDRMGVEVQLNAPVSQVTAAGLQVQDATFLPSRTVVWTAGVRGSPVAGQWGLPAGRGGRLATRLTLQVPGYPEIFVAGDLADPDPEAPPLPMTAPVATQQGTAVARNIRRLMAGRLALPFRYRDPGTMVTIGRNAAVAVLWGQPFTSFAAWLIWLGVHLFNLIGFRNRLVVLLAWAWDYLFSERVVRLILPTPTPRRFSRSPEPDTPAAPDAPRLRQP